MWFEGFVSWNPHARSLNLVRRGNRKYGYGYAAMWLLVLEARLYVSQSYLSFFN
jgi:hypothetical protein